MSSRSANETFQPVAGVLAFLLPGAGHAYLGEVRRGVHICIGVFFIFFSGIFIAGVDAIDSEEDFWWFVGQAPVGPVAFGIDRIHQGMKIHDPPPDATADWFEMNRPARLRSLGHVSEIGALFATIAGMLNAICIIDATWHAPRRRRGGRGGDA